MVRLIRNLTLFVLALLVVSLPSFVVAAPKTAQQDPELLVRKIMGLAYESNQSVNSVPFAVGNSLKKVKKAWGPADDLSTATANYYSHNVRFLYDNSTKRKKITGIDDFDPQVQTIHLADVTGLLGQPTKAVEQEGSYYVTYSYNKKHEVVFIFESITSSSNPTLFMYMVHLK